MSWNKVSRPIESDAWDDDYTTWDSDLSVWDYSPLWKSVTRPTD